MPSNESSLIVVWILKIANFSREIERKCVYRVVLQVQVWQQWHVEDSLSPDAAVTVRITTTG